MAKKPNWIYNQSGVIPFKITANNIKILLITSRKKKHLLIPKGIVEFKMAPQDSAVKEAFEEAGIRGELISGSEVGTYKYKKWGGTCKVRVYAFKVEEELTEWPESFIRERAWVDIKEISQKVDNSDLQKIILKLPDFISEHS